MIFGFNTDIKHDDTLYHVQSEAREAELLLQTQVFVRGRCIGKRATPYADRVASGNFTDQQKEQVLRDQHRLVLDAIRDELRRVDYVPVLFDFSVPDSRTTLETVSTLAHMSRFVIADLTDAKSVLQELQEIVPNCPSVAVQPLLLESQSEPGMWDFFKMKSSVLTPVRYINQQTLLSDLARKVIAPAEAKARELIGKMRS